jgi:outer membrane protein OmpA-like peptidoglycan-associated protein
MRAPMRAAVFALLLAAPQPTAAQPCNRACPRAERDDRGCCPATAARPTEPAGCTAGQHRSAGHCCDAGAEWVTARHRCVCLDASGCGGTAAAGPSGAAPPPSIVIRATAHAILVPQQIHFQTDSPTVLGDSFALLDAVAQFLLAHRELARVEVQGHTDNTGEAQHNLELSQARAESVRSALVERAVDASRLSARGYGDTRPLAPNVTALGRSRNRRIEFVILERR